MAASKPLLLVAYAQTLYVALLAGGQAMAAFMRTARGLVKGQGDAIFDFAAGIPPTEHRRFRAALREAVDAMGAKLTGATRPALLQLVQSRCADAHPAGAAEERSELLNEKRAIFFRNDAVIKATLATAQGSVVKASLRIALNVARWPAIRFARAPLPMRLAVLALLAVLLALLAAAALLLRRR